MIVLILCLALGLSGCAIKGSGISRNHRGERLAIERGRLTELTDSTARTKSYIVISDILLSFAADAGRDRDHEGFRGLLIEYSRAIESARDTMVSSERSAHRKSRGDPDLENALARQIKTLQNLRTDIEAEDRASLDGAIQLATAIREKIGGVASRTNSEN